MTLVAPAALTVGELACRHRVPVYGIGYLLERHQTRRAQKAGSAGVYLEADSRFIGAELRRIDAERERAA